MLSFFINLNKALDEMLESDRAILEAAEKQKAIEKELQ